MTTVEPRVRYRVALSVYAKSGPDQYFCKIYRYRRETSVFPRTIPLDIAKSGTHYKIAVRVIELVTGKYFTHRNIIFELLKYVDELPTSIEVSL